LRQGGGTKRGEKRRAFPGAAEASCGVPERVQGAPNRFHSTLKEHISIFDGFYWGIEEDEERK